LVRSSESLATELDGPMNSGFARCIQKSLPSKALVHHVGRTNGTVITWGEMLVFGQPLFGFLSEFVHSDHGATFSLTGYLELIT
jgi:hypothetical protein